MFDCFETGSELRGAVSSYLIDDSELSEIARTYGWPIGTWCVDLVEDFSSLFSAERDDILSGFNEDITNWNTSRATTMDSMFRDAVEFDQDISGWDMSRVESMSYMFRGASTFDQDLD